MGTEVQRGKTTYKAFLVKFAGGNGYPMGGDGSVSWKSPLLLLLKSSTEEEQVEKKLMRVSTS